MEKRRSTQENALIGIAAGGVGGVTSAVVTHPWDTLVRDQQEAARAGKKLKLTVSDYVKAFGDKTKWEGVGGSALKKGLGFGVGLGATFAMEAQLKKLLADIRSKQELNKLGFHKAL